MKTMAMQQRQVGKLTVKWDNASPVGILVSVHKPGLLVQSPLKTFADDSRSLEDQVVEAVAWAEQNQDKAAGGGFGLFG
jgi:hypothetical protein